ncbi:hypothetical protein [uncultured Campylobacter sp.]|uniref:hypothetical protein n=1 Tax=uncultured Campylobacter sp. TaxID=218934 RepID=UPI00260343D4|nr:hypothetical protein [uncultured Campylobacter sp.]
MGVYKNAFINVRRFAVHSPHMFRNHYRGASNLVLRRLQNFKIFKIRLRFIRLSYAEF